MGDMEGAQQYRLRWNNHSSSIISEFESLLGQEDFVDVTISCEKRNFKAHKVVLSACSAYFRKVLKDNPCQHPIIVLHDVGDQEIANILHFMYHGNVMVEQDRIPTLLQTAQMLEVRGLCDIKNSKLSQEKKEESLKVNPTFSGGVLSSNGAGAKRPAPDSVPTASSAQSNAAKRLKTSPGSTRPVPMLQSILTPQQIIAQQTIAKVVDASKLVGGPKQLVLKTLTPQLPQKIAVNSMPSVLTNLAANSSLENLLTALGPPSLVIPSKRASNSATSISSSDDVNERDEQNDLSLGDTENSNSQPEADFDSIVEVKEETPTGLDDEFNDDGSMHANSMSGAGDFSESDTELGGMSENSRGTHHLLTSPNALTATAKLKAVVSQVKQRSFSMDNNLFPQAFSVPFVPADTSSSAAEADPLAGDLPRKLAFHEPRPCPICRRMYRDAATLRTHTAIMHAEGRDPFACMCGEFFRTKYEMYIHKKNGHR